MSQQRNRQFLLFFITFLSIAGAAYFSYNLYKDSIKRSEIKNDYSDVNSITYGIMSVNVWKTAVTNILINQINEFSLTKDQDSLLHLHLTETIQNLVTKADSAIETNDSGFKGKVRKLAVDVFINTESIKEKAPQFSREIIDEVLEEKNKVRLKNLALSKLDEFASQTYDNKDSILIKEIYTKYNMNLNEDISHILLTKAKKLENKNYRDAFFVLAIVGLFLLLWFFVFKYPELHNLMYFMSVILALIVLIGGLTCSMIEIDARIDKVDFVLLGEHIKFENQVIFYRSKSILQLVQILFTNGKFDSIFVGILVFAFSVLLPISKMISAKVYLFGKESLRSNKILHWLTFKSGKWSMADVMVVAIFMAYVGFNGILDSQMEDLNVMTDSFTSIATNNTSLQPGYILFIGFVVFGLILSVVLKRILKRQTK